MTSYHARLRTPAQELHLKVRPAPPGVRLDLDGRFVFLTERTARELADALVDAAETQMEHEE